jgi:hypothetical protein
MRSRGRKAEDRQNMTFASDRDILPACDLLPHAAICSPVRNSYLLALPPARKKKLPLRQGNIIHSYERAGQFLG